MRKPRIRVREPSVNPTGRVWGPPVPFGGRWLTCFSAWSRKRTPLPGDQVARLPPWRPRCPLRRRERPGTGTSNKVGTKILYRVTVKNKGGSALFMVQKGRERK